jgi:hypothetical protein
MKKMTLMIIMIGIMILTFPLNAESNSESTKSKLDVNEMVLGVIKVIEDRDFDLYCRLFGKENTEKEKSEFNDD